MAKYYKKPRTVPYRFLVEAEIHKVELKLPSSGTNPNPNPQRISVIFKEDDVRCETRSAILVEGGVAYFREKLSVTATLIYDKKRKVFLQKEATLAINLINLKATKLMGVTKFDLAPYINNNIKEKNLALKMEKCSDKNAKFHFRLVINVIKDPVISRKTSRHSFKDIIRTGTFRESMKAIRESFGKQPGDQQIDNQNDELYSYYSTMNSPRGEKTKECDDYANETGRRLQMNLSLQQLVPQNGVFSKNGWKNSVFNQYEDGDGDDQLDQQDKVDIIEKELMNLANSLKASNQGFQGLQEEYEKLKASYNILKEKYEKGVPKEGQEPEIREGNESTHSQLKGSEIEKKAKDLENQNDLLTKKIQELEKLNTEYLTKIEGYVKRETKLTRVEAYDVRQYEKSIRAVINRLRRQVKTENKEVICCEELMNELFQKLSETKIKIARKDELLKLEKEKSQKQISLLEQKLQQALKEIEQYNQKEKVKGGDMIQHIKNVSFNSLRTREETTLEENDESSKMVLGDLAERTNDMSQALDGSGSESVKNSETSYLRQEINQLNAKLFAVTNLQRKYEEQIQKKTVLEEEAIHLRKQLEKANKAWSYADEERLEYINKLKEFKESPRTYNKKTELLELEVFKLKTKLSEVMNVTLELGKSDLLDKIELIMSRTEFSELRASLHKEDAFWE